MVHPMVFSWNSRDKKSMEVRNVLASLSGKRRSLEEALLLGVLYLSRPSEASLRRKLAPGAEPEELTARGFRHQGSFCPQNFTYVETEKFTVYGVIC